MLMLLALAAAVPPLPLNPAEEMDVRCVVTAALVKPPLAPPYLARRGEELLVLSGADIMDRTGRTREQVAALLTAEIARQKQAPATDPRPCNAHIERRLQAETIDPSAPLPKPLASPSR